MRVKQMMTQTMVKPSSWICTGIITAKVRDRYLFKFSEPLQDRLDNLNERLKGIGLNDQEKAELAGILELDQIFTLLNASSASENFSTIAISPLNPPILGDFEDIN
jgi:hypothetical protein